MAKCDLNHSRCFRIVLRTLWFDFKNGTPVTFLVIYSDCWTGSSRPCGTFEWVTMQHLLLLEWFILAVANLFMNCHLCLVACFASLTIFSGQACVLPRWIISFPDGRVTCPTFTLGAKYRYVGVQEVHHFNKNKDNRSQKPIPFSLRKYVQSSESGNHKTRCCLHDKYYRTVPWQRPKHVCVAWIECVIYL